MGGMMSVPGHDKDYKLLDFEDKSQWPAQIVLFLGSVLVTGLLVGFAIKLDNTNDTNTTTVEPDLITDTMETPLVGETDDAV